jgi:hypothetical protein
LPALANCQLASDGVLIPGAAFFCVIPKNWRILLQTPMIGRRHSKFFVPGIV